MIGFVNRLRRLARDRRGATIVEFAFVAPPLVLLLLGLTDFGYRAYVASVVEGTVHRAARLATVGNKTSSEIDDYVRSQLLHFSSSGTVTITKTNYYDFSGIGKSEKLTTDSAPLGVWNAGDCYEDLNDDGTWQAVAGRDGLGGSDDIVYYQVSLTYARLVPMGGFLGWSDTQTISANTVMRNQPYASQIIPTIKCTSA